MAGATTTKIAIVLLLIHSTIASKDATWSEWSPMNFSDQPHSEIDVKINDKESQYLLSRQRHQQSPKNAPRNPLTFRSGREFTLFDQRGVDEEAIPVSSTSSNIPSSNSLGNGGSPSPRGKDGTNHPYRSSSRTTDIRRRKRSARYGSGYPTGGDGGRYVHGTGDGASGGRAGSGRRGANGSGGGNPLTNLREWITTSGNLPRIQCRVEPNTTLKVRKTFRPLKTLVELGADFNTQLGVWQFKSSWEDRIIGGKITLAGREMQFSKTWLLSVGVVEDLVTRLRLRAAVDLGTMKAYARLGFRTERLSPINVVEGFTLTKKLPLDGNYGHVKLEVKANFAFPEPEIEYSTENHRSFVGMGDIEVNIDELNLLLNY